MRMGMRLLFLNDLCIICYFCPRLRFGVLTCALWGSAWILGRGKEHKVGQKCILWITPGWEFVVCSSCRLAGSQPTQGGGKTGSQRLGRMHVPREKVHNSRAWRQKKKKKHGKAQSGIKKRASFVNKTVRSGGSILPSRSAQGRVRVPKPHLRCMNVCD